MASVPDTNQVSFERPSNAGAPGWFEESADNVGAAVKDPIGGVVGFVKGTVGLPWDIAEIFTDAEIAQKPDILKPKTPAEKGGDTIGMVAGVAGLAKGIVKGGIKVTKRFAKAGDDVADAAKRGRGTKRGKGDPEDGNGSGNSKDGTAKSGPPGAESGNARGKRLLEKQTEAGHPDLPAREAANFQSAEPAYLQPGEKIYRVQGGPAGPNGGYYTREPPSSMEQFRRDNAVRENWNNGSQIQEVTVGPNGMKVWQGPAASQNVADVPTGYHYPGGGQQIYVPGGQVFSAGDARVSPTNWN